MTEEQKAMLKDAPERETIKPIVTKKRLAITAGLAAVGVGAYFIGPKIVKKVQLKKALEAGVHQL